MKSLGEEANIKTAADEAYKTLTAAGVGVLYDDRNERPGEKFADADLMGLPLRLVISQKSLEAGGYELKPRNGEAQIIPENKLVELIVKAGQVWYNRHNSVVKGQLQRQKG